MDEEKLKRNYKKVAVKLSLLFVVLLITSIALLDQEDILSKISPDLDNGVNHLSTPGLDFPKDAGSGTLSGKVNDKYFKEPIDDPVVLFASANIPGLAMIYYPHEKRIIAGTPQMIAENIELFEGKKHTINYSFKRDGKQLFLYDGKLVAKSDFSFNKNDLTGFVTGAPENVISEGFAFVEINVDG